MAKKQKKEEFAAFGGTNTGSIDPTDDLSETEKKPEPKASEPSPELGKNGNLNWIQYVGEAPPDDYHAAHTRLIKAYVPLNDGTMRNKMIDVTFDRRYKDLPYCAYVTDDIIKCQLLWRGLPSPRKKQRLVPAVDRRYRVVEDPPTKDRIGAETKRLLPLFRAAVLNPVQEEFMPSDFMTE